MMSSFKPILDTMQAYKPGKPIEETKKEFGLTEVIKLASNENPYGYSEQVKQFLKEEMHALELYPDANATDLKASIANRLAIEPEQLIVGNGSDEIISVLSRAVLDPTKETIIPTPVFPQYAHNAKVEGATIIEVPLTKEGQHDFEGMLAAITDQTAIIWVCNPNNPVGTLLDSEALYAFIQQIPSSVFVVLDEAYVEYITDETYVDSIQWVKEFPNLIILRTFSKAYGLASIRVGYGIGEASVIEQLNKVKNPFNGNTLALKMAEIAFNDQAFIEKCVKQNAVERQRFVEFATTHRLKIYPSQTNFVLLETKEVANVVSERLMQNGLIVRSGDLLGTPHFIRVTVGTTEQNDRFFEVYEQLMKE